MKLRWNEDISFFTRERVKPVKITCICGHVVAFISNAPRYCTHCGRKVYPTKKSEFREKLMKEINKCQ